MLSLGDRLATDIQQTSQSVWPHRRGHVRLSIDHSVPSLFQLVARSLCSGNRCSSTGFVSDTGACQSSLERNWPGPIPGAGTASMHRAGGTSLEESAMVPTSSTNICGCRIR